MVRPRFADIAAIILSTATAAVMGFMIYSGYTEPEIIEITAPSGIMVYQLDQDREISVRGPLGDSLIVIKNGEAFFADSPCPDKLCVKTGHLHDAGQWAGCLPNRIFIKIKGAEKKEDKHEKIDALSF